jgi:molecular chaperone DnaJ
MKRDYYEVLGVEKTATEDEIKKAYRKRALEFHPDRNPGDHSAEEKFKEATEAYEILHDQDKRSRYDRFGHAAADGGFGAGGAGVGFEGFDLSDALRAFMRDFGGDDFFGFGGAAAGRRGARQGQNLQVRLSLTLEEIAKGVSKKIRLKRLNSCDQCRGSGAKPGTEPTTCPDCGGAGQVRQVQRSLLGQFVTVAACRRCGGLGSAVNDPCPTCRGEGRVQGTETLSVDIPAGVAEGNFIPIHGKGHVGLQGGPPGDLVILIHEKPHEVFERHGDDLFCDVAIPFTTAALGGKVEVPTLGGSARLDVPAGTQSHKVFRLRNQGIRHLHSNRSGDELVRVRVWTPKKLSSDEKKLLEKLAEIQDEPPRPGRGIFEKIRDSFR